MKIPLKYGLLITLGVMVWVILARTIVTNPQSTLHTLGTPIFFNVLQFIMIYVGLKAAERARGEKLGFKDGLKTGVAISFVYALTTSLFFVGVVLFVGTKWLTEGASPNVPASAMIAQAFAGLFLLIVIFGLVYSTLISFFLAKRRSDEA